MKNLIKNNIISAKKFNNTMRYIHVDDLLTLNNTQFDAAIQDIHVYPQELQLKKTTALSYLDVTIDNGRYSTAVFDKGTVSHSTS